MSEVVFQYQIPEKMIGTFVIDAFVAEHYQFSNAVTEIPVEEGAVISDQMVEEQDVISIEAFIGNAAFEVVEMNGNSITNLEAPDRMARVRQAYIELKKMTKAKRLYDIVLGLETYSSMAITSFEIDRKAETGANLPFTMEFKKLKIVRSDTTEINVSRRAGGAGDQTSGTLNAGVSGTEQPSDSIAKEEWRFSVRRGVATPEEYQRKWGVPFPQ